MVQKFMSKMAGESESNLKAFEEAEKNTLPLFSLMKLILLLQETRPMVKLKKSCISIIDFNGWYEGPDQYCYCAATNRP